MKKANKKTTVPLSLADIELRKWCIEQANSWRWDAGQHYGLAGGYPPQGRSASEPDVVGRAERILKWVRG